MLRTDIIKKAEKIASAIYMVTNFFDDKEPLKWRLRALSVDLVSEVIKDTSKTAKEMLSYILVAKVAGLVSETNHNILAQELSKFNNELEQTLETFFITENVESLSSRNSLPITPHTTADGKMNMIIKDKTYQKPTLKAFGVVSVKKNSRQSIIIAILKRKKEIMIKDVSPLIHGCSEKTIQRELSAMVHGGILKKIGEKRWSRYSLVSNV